MQFFKNNIYYVLKLHEEACHAKANIGPKPLTGKFKPPPSLQMLKCVSLF